MPRSKNEWSYTSIALRLHGVVLVIKSTRTTLPYLYHNTGMSKKTEEAFVVCFKILAIYPAERAEYDLENLVQDNLSPGLDSN
jgi:hypothetical protein